MIGTDQLVIQVRIQPPPGERDPKALWRRADVVLNGKSVAVGYAMKRHDDTEKSVRGEAVTLAKAEFDKRIQVTAVMTG